MGAITDGLHGYEIIMLFCGVILFAALVFLLIYQVLHAKPILPLLISFCLPIVMIGYPSIQKFQIDKTSVTIEKGTDALLSQPTDSQVREQLQNQVKDLSQRTITNPQTLTILAKAQYALGDEKSAKENLKRAIDSDPNANGAKELAHKISWVDNLRKLTSTVKADPGDHAARSKIEKELATADQTRVANPNALTAIASAQAALGQNASALETVNKAVKIKPDSESARLLQRSLGKQVGPTDARSPGHP